MKLKPGDLIFVRGKDWISRIIEWITKSKYSHVAIYASNGKVIEAQGSRKVGYRSLSYYQGQYDVYRVPMTDLQLVFGFDWLKKQFGRPYDYWDIFVLFLRCLFHLKIPWHEGHRILCSRLARDFISECLIRIPDEDMTPEDFLEWVKQNNGYAISA